MEDIEGYWGELYLQYPDAQQTNPEITLEVEELREFCESLPSIKNSPLMKALE